MNKVSVVTGAGTGLGRALVLALAGSGRRVLALGRRPAPLESLKSEDPDRIDIVSADVSSAAGRAAIDSAIAPGTAVEFLVHNAGVLEPVAPLAEVSLEDWRRIQAINVEGPLFVTQKLLPRLGGGRILHISSGAAHHAYAGWGAYCASKAALHMIYLVYREELHAAGVAIGSLRPGVVDTPMQERVRAADPRVFPRLQRFVDLKSGGGLHAAEDVANFIVQLLTSTDDREFSAEEWYFDRDRDRFASSPS